MATLNQLGRTLTRNTSMLRKDIDMSLTEMSYLTGVSRRTLGRIEQARAARRTYSPMLKTVVKLAAATGVTVDEYLNNNFRYVQQK
jgi:transcriptional regulator with XRE-family HTH domain